MCSRRRAAVGAAALLIGTAAWVAPSAMAAEVVPDVTEVTFTDPTTGEPLDGSLTVYEQFDLRLEYSLPDGVASGDTFTIEFPAALAGIPDPDLLVVDPDTGEDPFSHPGSRWLDASEYDLEVSEDETSFTLMLDVVEGAELYMLGWSDRRGPALHGRRGARAAPPDRAARLSSRRGRATAP